MKYSNVLLAENIRSKLMGDALEHYVGQVFVQALPFDEKDIAKESAKLDSYARKVVRSLHSENLLDRAIENASSHTAMEFLTDLRSNMSKVVENATQKELSKAHFDEIPSPEVAKQAKLEMEDVDRLANASKHAGIKAISELVKKKVIDTIKDERESYEQAEKIRNEIKDMVKSEKDDLRETLNPDENEDTRGPLNQDPTPESVDESVIDDQADPNANADSEAEEAILESYFNQVLNPQDPRNHVSLFSKLQDVCMENVMASAESYKGEIPYDTLERITLESTFPIFDMNLVSLEDEVRYMSSMEAYADDQHGNSEEEKIHRMKHTANTAFICTVCILTLLETLKTMHLTSPSAKMVRDYVDTPTQVDDNTSAELERIENKVENRANDIKKSVAMGALTSLETAEAKEALTNVRKRFESLKLPVTANEAQSRILDKMDIAIEMALPTFEREIRTDSTAVRLKEENIVNLDHAMRVLGRRPAVESIQLWIDSETPMGDDRSSVDIVAKGFEANGTQAYETAFTFNTPSFLGHSIMEAVQECMQYCDFQSKVKQPISFYFTNERYSTPLVINN